jgi:uncharacterized protein (TIGR02300 family)
MASSALGIKRHCQSCDGKFYDLNKEPIVCPSCNKVFDPEIMLKSRRSKPVVAAQAKPVEVEDESVNDDEDIDDVDADLESDAEVLGDESDLIVVSAEGNDEDEVGTPEKIPLEDNLDAVDVSDVDDGDQV